MINFLNSGRPLTSRVGIAELLELFQGEQFPDKSWWQACSILDKAALDSPLNLLPYNVENYRADIVV